MAEVSRLRGRVEWFDEKKGIGFIHPDEWATGQDLFVHYSQIHTRETYKTLKEKQRVEFTIGVRDGDSRQQAEAVVVLAEEGAVA